MENRLQKNNIYLTIKNELFKYRYIIILILILAIGFSVRLVNISEIPGGLNQDEASAGYEAYSILNYGIDRNGNTNPVQFVAWGSGQNVLYSYIMIPFIKIFGLTEFSVRLPMAIVGCISLFVFYLLLNKFTNKKIALLGIFFLAICPWHVMKSRWGLESNLFPDLILWGTYFILEGVKGKRKYCLYIASVIYGIAVYSYGTSYFFLPIFFIPLLVFLYLKKYISLKESVISLLIVVIISIPMILFIFINTFDFPQINLPYFTIPRLTANRYQEISSVFSSEFITNSLGNFKNAMKIFILQSNDLPWNLIDFFGITYVVSLPFAIIGGISAFRKKSPSKNINFIFNIWFISALLLLFVCKPNVNRCNIFIFPLIYYTVLGIYNVCYKDKKLVLGIISMYSILFILFINRYVNTNFTFEEGYKEAIEYVNKIDDKKIYITNSINQPYIYTLFYLKYNVNDYINTVDFATKGENFEVVRKFGKFNFYIPKELEKNSIYLVKNLNEINDLDDYNYTIKEINNYIILDIISKNEALS